MSQLDELQAEERAEQQKRRNAPNDQKTRDLFSQVQSRFDGRKIANGQVELKALLDDPFNSEARVLLRIFKSSLTAPEWLWASEAHNNLITARFVNGKYHLEGKRANGTILVGDCDSVDDLMNVMEAYLAKMP